MEDQVFALMQSKKREKELVTLVSFNEKTEQFGLSLTKEEAEELMLCRNESLKKYRRVEFGEGILDKVVFLFCDSQYITQENYLEVLEQLQDIFYEYKNEAEEKLTDDELLTFMKEQYESVCFGDTDYLEGTCLERFSVAIRAGYVGYQASGGHNEYEKLSQELRWDKDLYQQVLKELFWG